MNGLQIYPDLEENGTCDPYVAIRWCVSPDLVKRLEKEKVVNPMLLISIRSMSGDTYVKETRRYLVPLTQELHHVAFSYSGKNSIGAVVVSGDYKDARWLYLQHLDSYRKGTRYATPIYGMPMDYKTGQSRMDARPIIGQHTDFVRRHSVRASILDIWDEKLVDVPKEMFAKEPSQFYKDYTAKFTRSQPLDECDMRRRVLLTTPLMPFIFGFGMLARYAQVVFGAIMLMFPMDLRGLRHPNTSRWLDILDGANKPYWWFRKRKNSSLYEPQNFFLLAFNPINIFVGAVLVFLITSLPFKTVNSHIPVLKHGKPVFDEQGSQVFQAYKTHWAHIGFVQCIVWVSLFLAGIIAIVAAFLVIGALVQALKPNSRPQKEKKASPLTKWIDAHREKKYQKQRKIDAQAAREFFASLSEMSCNGGASRVALDALPKHKRTIKLRYQATKKKVCRPFVT